MQRLSRPFAQPLQWQAAWRKQGRSCTERHALQRREVLDYASVLILQQYAVLDAWALAESTPQQQQEFHVGLSGQQYASVQAAVDAAPAGSRILIQPGKYREQLVIAKSLTLAAAQQAGSVEILVETQQPYQHCLEVPLGINNGGNQPVQVVVQGISFRHYSKSVADNYCIFTQSGTLLLQQCDISSRSGVGVCVQGAALKLDTCTVHDCEGHGCTVYGSLEGDLGRCTLTSSRIVGNRLDGVLVRDGADFNMLDCDVQGNGRYGVQLQDCSAVLAGNIIVNNRAGPAAVQVDSSKVHLQLLKDRNKLGGEVQLL